MNCLQKRTDCRFYNDAACDILRDTNFDRPCPFFKKGGKIISEREFPGRKGVFRSVRGFEEEYFVSEYAEVVSKFGNKIAVNTNASGALVVYLRTKDRNYMGTRRSLATIVADAWVPGAGPVYFKDGDRYNCKAENLRRREDGKQNK